MHQNSRKIPRQYGPFGKSYKTLFFSLGFGDIRQAYRRSAIGPFWITAGMAIQIATMGLVFGLIFKTELQDYLPFLASSIILWGFISSVLNEGCLSFIAAEAVIKQIKAPLYVHFLRVVWKNLIALGHNLVILPLVFLAVLHYPSWTVLVFLPGLAILVLNLSWMTVILGLVSARYRDMPPIINSLTIVAFYITPVVWYPDLIGNNQLAHLLLGLNPFYHLLQIVRLPILGGLPTPENWGLSMLLAGVGWLIAAVVLRKYRMKVPYWV